MPAGDAKSKQFFSAFLAGILSSLPGMPSIQEVHIDLRPIKP